MPNFLERGCERERESEKQVNTQSETKEKKGKKDRHWNNRRALSFLICKSTSCVAFFSQCLNCSFSFNRLDRGTFKLPLAEMKPIEALFLLSTLKAAERATAVTEDSFHSFTWAGKRDSTKYLMSQESGALIWRRTKWRAKWRFIATDCHRAQERNLLDKKKSSLLLQDCSSVSVGITLFGSFCKMNPIA